MNELNLGNHRGLSEEEAAAKIKESGWNEIPAAKKRSIFAIAFEVLREPMFLMHREIPAEILGASSENHGGP
jgi:Ca2+-transporting ATPase